MISTSYVSLPTVLKNRKGVRTYGVTTRRTLPLPGFQLRLRDPVTKGAQPGAGGIKIRAAVAVRKCSAPNSHPVRDGLKPPRTAGVDRGF